MEQDQQEYIARRRANEALWAGKAQLHGRRLAATASTGWVRAGTLRRLRRLVRTTDRVLEVGCGNGNLLGPLARRCRAIGIDLTSEMLHLAKTHEVAIRGLVRADAAWLPFRDASFDVVYTSRCLINVQDPRMQVTALREILRVARPNGTIVLSENFQEPVDRLNRARIRFHAGPVEADEYNLRLNLENTLRLCAEHGWVATRVQGFPMSSLLQHVVVGWLTRYRGGGLAARLAEPLVAVVARLDGAGGGWLPLLGKDTTVTLARVGKG